MDWDSGQHPHTAGANSLHDALMRLTVPLQPAGFSKILRLPDHIRGVGVGTNEVARKRAAHLALLLTALLRGHPLLTQAGHAELRLAYGELFEWLERAEEQVRAAIDAEGIDLSYVGSLGVEDMRARPSKAPRLR